MFAANHHGHGEIAENLSRIAQVSLKEAGLSVSGQSVADHVVEDALVARGREVLFVVSGGARPSMISERLAAAVTASTLLSRRAVGSPIAEAPGVAAVPIGGWFCGGTLRRYLVEYRQGRDRSLDWLALDRLAGVEKISSGFRIKTHQSPRARRYTKENQY